MLGILLMLGFCVLAPMGDALAKVLGETIPLGQLLVTRFGVQAALLIPFAWLTARSLKMNRRVFRLMLYRTGLHIIGIGAMFTSLRFLPLADAVAIAFVMPFIMLLLGRYVLGETVGARRLIACCVGFIGTLLVIQPSFAAVGLPALLPLVVAVVFALFMLVTRQIAKDVDPISLQAVSGVVATIFLGVLLLLPDLLPGPQSWPMFDIVFPSGLDYALLLTIGIIGTLAHLLMTWSLRFAPSATLAPMQYLEIPFATMIGYLIFQDWPNGLAFLGITITMASGLYIVARERQTARLVPPET
ncbi:membrane protein [Litoreibacter roseus]|uniref:Membrane protein n=2 Tax=Litoreibacter roseus TaxID=2601869 RepID=A0A6N6JDU4_9RHOB|nr:membrane protein [Litoreibacter roseus]